MITQHICNNAEEELQSLLTSSFSRLCQSNGIRNSLISNEGLCNNVFAHAQRLKLLIDCSRKAGYKTIKCLLVVRNPYEHMCSWFLEGLKGTGWAAFTSIEAYAEKYNDLPAIANAISNMNNLNIQFKCLNYSSCRASLLPLFLDWAGISVQDDSHLLATPAKPVNRSLDFVEQAICQALARNGIKPALFASNLLNSEAASKSLSSESPTNSIPFVDPDALETMERNNQPYADLINRHLSEPDHIVFDKTYFPSKPIERLTISREQLQSIVATFSRILDQHASSKPWKINQDS